MTVKSILLLISAHLLKSVSLFCAGFISCSIMDYWLFYTAYTHNEPLMNMNRDRYMVLKQKQRRDIKCEEMLSDMWQLLKLILVVKENN